MAVILGTYSHPTLLGTLTNQAYLKLVTVHLNFVDQTVTITAQVWVDQAAKLAAGAPVEQRVFTLGAVRATAVLSAVTTNFYNQLIAAVPGTVLAPD